MTTKTLIGWSDLDTCECCGRRDLERTMMVMNENGTINYYGSMCGAKILGRQGATRTQIEKSVTRAQEATTTFRLRHWTAVLILRAQQGGRTEDAAKRQQQQDAELARWLKDGARPEQVTYYAQAPFKRTGPAPVDSYAARENARADREERQNRADELKRQRYAQEAKEHAAQYARPA